MSPYFARKSHLISLAMAVLTVLAIGLLSWRDWREYSRDLAETAAIEQSSERLRLLLSLLKDTEIGQRGFLLTGDSAYLKPYTDALPQLARLGYGPGASPRAESESAAQLNDLVATTLAQLARTIEIRRQGDVDAALSIVRTNEDKDTMDHIRSSMIGLIHAQTEQLNRLESTLHRNETTTRVATFLGAGLLAFLITGAGLHIDRLFTMLDRSRDEQHRQRATLATMLNSIGDAVIATDNNGQVTFFNPVAESLTGWPSGEAMGRSLPEVFRIINESSRQTVDDPVGKVLQTGTVVGLANHTLLLACDGREIPIDDCGAPIRDETGSISGVVLVFRDVEKERRAQHEVEESAQRYRLLFNDNPQPMWVFDAETLAFLAVNNAAVHNYGYTRDEFLGMTLRDIRPQEEISTLLSDLQSGAVSPGGPRQHRRKDGTGIIVEIISHPIEFDGRSAGLVLASDITERRKLEEQFQQAQRLEGIGRLAGGVAHDFNNLLTVIKGHAEILTMDLPPSDPLCESVTEIGRAANRAASLTQQLLAFSRKQLIQPTVTNVNDTMMEMDKMLRRLIGEHIQLITKLSPDLGRVKADVGQLQQVVMNLAVNARDAMPDGGSLFFETANISFDAAYAATHTSVQPGDYVMLAITDTGTGMTPEVQSRLFEPFFTTKPRGAGTGLGLATVYGIVRQSSGWIWVYSEPGHGSTFKIYLPRTDEVPAPVSAAPKPQRRGDETILLVEDQLEVATVAATALRRFGYVVLAAGSGEEALSVAGEYPRRIDLVLTDVVMPGLNGLDLALRLKSVRPEISVLFMSGYTEHAVTNRTGLEAAGAYIQKPFTPDALAEKIREILGPRPDRAKILLVEDDESLGRHVRKLLTDAGFAVIEAASGAQALARITEGNQPDLVLSEVGIPGAGLIPLLQTRLPRLRIIAMSDTPGGAQTMGAAATLRKPVSRDDLLRAVQQVLRTVPGRRPGED